MGWLSSKRVDPCVSLYDLVALQVPESATSMPANSEHPASTVQALRHELEQDATIGIAQEDPFNGERIVQLIEKPFILPDETAVADSWRI